MVIRKCLCIQIILLVQIYTILNGNATVTVNGIEGVKSEQKCKRIEDIMKVVWTCGMKSKRIKQNKENTIQIQEID